jgi:hypothetical protein
MSSRLIKGWKRGKKEKWVLGRWILQMSFKKSSSEVEGECSLGRVSRKSRKKALG